MVEHLTFNQVVDGSIPSTLTSVPDNSDVLGGQTFLSVPLRAMTKPRKVDQRGKLDEMPFGYRATKDGRVFISWNGRQVTTLAGKDAERFLARIEVADAKAAQLVMARATGHFKHGNE